MTVASDERFMREALALARHGLEADEMPVGAVVTLENEIIGTGYWQYRPDGLLDHAEMLALRAAEGDRRLQGHRGETTLYATLEPCLLCMGGAMSFGTGRVVFALEARFDGASSVAKQWQPELGFPPPGFQVFSNPDVTGGVCRDQALELIRSYVESHADTMWLRAMLPGFAYPDDVAS
jgi:tRNA(adenine34) deaminase